MQVLKIPALEVTQSPGRKLYSFAVDGKVIPRFAAISRVKREAGALQGYQRPEVVSHIEEIRNYLESGSPMIPNAIVLAFDSRVRFQPILKGIVHSAHSRLGELLIPLMAEGTAEKLPGFVVDGQQRLAAVREADIAAFPLCVSAFITDDIHEQTEQFILVNSTKPLPKGLLYELLPGTQAQLPSLLHKRRFPALLLEQLNSQKGGPFEGLINTPTNPDGLVKDNSILRMLENSLSDGVLYRFRGESPDIEAMLEVLSNFWWAVADTFEPAWRQPPKRSRLMHGAGVISMGFVMDAICDRLRGNAVPSRRQFLKDLEPLVGVCRWTDGYWDFGGGIQRKWNELQNTSKDIDLLSNHLIAAYKSLVWSRASEAATKSRGVSRA